MTKSRVDYRERRRTDQVTDHLGVTSKYDYDYSVQKISIRSDGYKNSRWRDRVKSSEGATTDLSGNVYGFLDTAGDLTLTVKQATDDPRKVKRNAFGQLVNAENPPSPLAGLLESADRHCAVEFYGHCKDKLNKLQSIVALGEAAQTCRMIRDRSKKLAGGVQSLLDRYRRLKRGKRKKKKKLIDEAAETWLEGSYGWVPLISDVKSAAEALNENINRWRRAVEPVWSMTTAEQPDRMTEVTDYTVFSGLMPFRVHGVSGFKATIRCKGAVKIEFDNAREFDSALFGFTPSDFVPSAWELIPYSFLVDYFTNVGDVLYAWSFPMSKLAWVNVTRRNSAWLRLSGKIMGAQVRSSWGEQYLNFEGDVGQSEVSYTSFQRTGQAPELSLGSFRVQLNLNPTKLINLAALAVTHRRLLPFR